jgi:hypothetical protein
VLLTVFIAARAVHGILQVGRQPVVTLPSRLRCHLECDRVEGVVVAAGMTTYERLDVLARASHGPTPEVVDVVSSVYIVTVSLALTARYPVT